MIPCHITTRFNCDAQGGGSGQAAGQKFEDAKNKAAEVVKETVGSDLRSSEGQQEMAGKAYNAAAETVRHSSRHAHSEPVAYLSLQGSCTTLLFSTEVSDHRSRRGPSPCLSVVLLLCARRHDKRLTKFWCMQAEGVKGKAKRAAEKASELPEDAADMAGAPCLASDGDCCHDTASLVRAFLHADVYACWTSMCSC